MPAEAYANAVSRLSALGPLRAWSLLVTVFGDLAPRDALDGPTLSAIMSEIGIKPEATRVALHRLRSDGWIVSQKSGRNSLHRLSDKGQSDSDAARPRIYAAPSDDTPAQFVLIPEGAPAPDATFFAPVAPRLYVSSAYAQVPNDALVLHTGALPRWFETTSETTELRDGYDALHSALDDIIRALPARNSFSPLQTAVFRVLIVHAWRRLALKHPVLPRAAHSDDWRGHTCSVLVTTLLDRFPRPPLDQIRAS